MTLATYSGLYSAFNRWTMNRGDLSSEFPDLLALVNQRIHYGSIGEGVRFPSLPLRSREMEDTETLSLTDGVRSIALPNDYLETRMVYLVGDDGQELSYVPPHVYWAKYYDDDVEGRPEVYTIEGGYLRFGPVPDQSYTGKLAHWVTIAALTEAAPTNWLLTKAPGVYLYGALIEALPLIGDDERLAQWYTAFLGAVGGLRTSDTLSRRPASGVKLRPSLPFGSGGFDIRTG